MTDLKVVRCPRCNWPLKRYLIMEGIDWLKCHNRKDCGIEVEVVYTNKGNTVDFGTILDKPQRLIAQSHKLVTRRPKSLA